MIAEWKTSTKVDVVRTKIAKIVEDRDEKGLEITCKDFIVGISEYEDGSYSAASISWGNKSILFRMSKDGKPELTVRPEPIPVKVKKWGEHLE